MIIATNLLTSQEQRDPHEGAGNTLRRLRLQKNTIAYVAQRLQSHGGGGCGRRCGGRFNSHEDVVSFGRGVGVRGVGSTRSGCGGYYGGCDGVNGGGDGRIQSIRRHTHRHTTLCVERV